MFLDWSSAFMLTALIHGSYKPFHCPHQSHSLQSKAKSLLPSIPIQIFSPKIPSIHLNHTPQTSMIMLIANEQQLKPSNGINHPQTPNLVPTFFHK